MADNSVHKVLKARAAACKRWKDQHVSDWRTQIDYRKGEPFRDSSEHDRVAVNVDFPYTKAKQASLFSQVPQVVLTPKHPQFAPAAAVFGQALNDTLTAADVGTAMDECLPDMINAAGIAAVLIQYESLVDTVDLPIVEDISTLPEEIQAAVMTGAVEIPTQPTQRVRDARFTVTRLDPEMLLWETSHKRSDFNKMPWVGYTGSKMWEEAKREFGLTDEQKEKVCGPDDMDAKHSTYDDPERKDDDSSIVWYDEIFYWRYRYHSDETSFSAIQRVVYVRGVDEPVVDEPWKGQRYDEATGSYLGSCLPPIQFCSLTYISNEPVPPSDSFISRPQVDEMNRSRTQMVEAREHNIPIVQYDINRLDPEVRDLIMRGLWKGWIPVQGSTEVVKEVSRGQFPPENFAFERVVKGDMQQQWGLSENQVGAFASGERSAEEAGNIDKNTQIRNGKERAQCVAFFVRIAEVTAGLLALYGEFDVPTELGASIGEDGVARLQSWNRDEINQKFAFTVRADSTVLLDTEQKLARSIRALNYLAKAPGSNVQPILKDIAAMSGYDSEEVVKDPVPPPPEPPKIAFSFKGEDLVNPIAVAIMMEGGVAPTPESLRAAKALMTAAYSTMPGEAPIPPAPMPPPEVGLSGNVPTSEMDAPEPEPPPVPNYDAQPDYQMADRVNNRREGQI